MTRRARLAWLLIGIFLASSVEAFADRNARPIGARVSMVRAKLGVSGPLRLSTTAAGRMAAQAGVLSEITLVPTGRRPSPFNYLKVTNGQLAPMGPGLGSVLLDWHNKPAIEVHFRAAPDLYYAVECVLEPLKQPSTIGYTLQWTSSAGDHPPDPHPEILVAPALQYVEVAIPKAAMVRDIIVTASDFQSSKYLWQCTVAPLTSK